MRAGELRHQAGVVEVLLLVVAQVGLGTAHPEQIALDDHFPACEASAVILDQPFQGEREQAVDAAVDEPVGLARLLR